MPALADGGATVHFATGWLSIPSSIASLRTPSRTSTLGSATSGLSDGRAQRLLRPDVDWWDLIRHGPRGFSVHMRITLARDADRLLVVLVLQ